MIIFYIQNYIRNAQALAYTQPRSNAKIYTIVSAKISKVRRALSSLSLFSAVFPSPTQHTYNIGLPQISIFKTQYTQISQKRLFHRKLCMRRHRKRKNRHTRAAETDIPVGTVYGSMYYIHRCAAPGHYYRSWPARGHKAGRFSRCGHAHEGGGGG